MCLTGRERESLCMPKKINQTQRLDPVIRFVVWIGLDSKPSTRGIPLWQTTNKTHFCCVARNRLTLKRRLGVGRDPSLAHMLCKMHGYRRRTGRFCAVSCIYYMVWSYQKPFVCLSHSSPHCMPYWRRANFKLVQVDIRFAGCGAEAATRVCSVLKTRSCVLFPLGTLTLQP